MTMNISTLPSVPKGEARHAMRNENDAEGFDVKTLMKSKMLVKTSGAIASAIEEKNQPDVGEEQVSDNWQPPSTELHELLTQQQLQPAVRPHTVTLSASSDLNPPPMPLWSSAVEDAVRAHAGLQAPTEQLEPKAGRGAVEQLPVKADTKAAVHSTPAIADVVSKMQHVDQFSAVPAIGAAPKPGAVPLQSVTVISGQFAQTVTILPPVGPAAQARSKNDLAALREVAPRSDAEPATTVKLGKSPESAKASSIGDRQGPQPTAHQVSGGNVQAAGPESSQVFATPARQIVDAVDDEVSSLGARLKAQAVLAAENPASGKLPLLSRIKVDLNPASLGAVRIEIAMSAAGEVELNLITARETTAAMIEGGREEVLGGLQSRAVEVRGFTVNTGEIASNAQTGSHQEGSAARFSGHGDGQPSRHLLNGRGDGHGNETGQEKATPQGEAPQQTVRNSTSGIYI